MDPLGCRSRRLRADGARTWHRSDCGRCRCCRQTRVRTGLRAGGSKALSRTVGARRCAGVSGQARSTSNACGTARPRGHRLPDELWPARVALQVGAGDTTFSPHARLHAGSGNVLTHAAVAGLGLAQTFEYHVTNEIAERKLEVVLSHLEPEPRVVQALFSRQNADLPKVRVFVEFLAQLFSTKHAKASTLYIPRVANAERRTPATSERPPGEQRLDHGRAWEPKAATPGCWVSSRASSLACRSSGRRDSNPRRQPWQGCTLPLSYSRVAGCFSNGRVPRCQALAPGSSR